MHKHPVYHCHIYGGYLQLQYQGIVSELVIQHKRTKYLPLHVIVVLRTYFHCNIDKIFELQISSQHIANVVKGLQHLLEAEQRQLDLQTSFVVRIDLIVCVHPFPIRPM